MTESEVDDIAEKIKKIIEMNHQLIDFVERVSKYVGEDPLWDLEAQILLNKLGIKQ